MNTKRILALALGILMLIPLALTAFAYTTPYADLQVSATATSNLTISGSSTNFDKVGTLSNVAPSTKSCTFNVSDETGALHLNNTGTDNQAYTTGNKGTTAAGGVGTWVSTTNGMTFDLYAKFANLPKITSSSVMTDTGVVSGNPSNVYFSGLVFNLCSSEKYMADSSKTNNELQAVFAYYDNATTGTNACLILPYGNRNAFTSASAVTYFFNAPKDEYARYTLTFDPVAKTTNFYVDGVAQTYNGTSNTTFNNVALCYRATATVNFLNINLNNAQAGVSANNGTYKANVYIDQLNVYPSALTPMAGGAAASFEGDPVPAVANTQTTNALNLYNDLKDQADEYFNPTFWNAFKGWVEYCYDIIDNGGNQSDLDAACTGTSGNWFMNRLTWLSTAGATATTGGSAATVAGTGTVIPANTPIVTGTDRIWISHASYDGSTDAYGWTNSSIILTRAGMSMSEYAAYGNNLYSIAMSSSWRAYKCLPTKATGIYRVSELGYNKDFEVPEGGFLVVANGNGVANGSVLTSTYASELFGNRNERAFSAIGIEVGDYVKLEGVTLNEGAAATLSTTGTWYCANDPRMSSPSDLNRVTTASDYFEGFKTNAAMVKVDASTISPDAAIKVTVEGTGSVSATVDSTAVSDPASFIAAVGSTVSLTATGDNFVYWKNASTGAILSTLPDMSFTFGGSALSVVAVFAPTGDASATHTVTFKDGVTGKIVGTATVDSGSVVPTASIPEITPFYGYIFKGWYANNDQSAPIESYTVTGNITFYSRYRSDEASFYNLTINDGESRVLRMRYAKIAVVTAASSSFTNWTFDGNFYSSASTVQFSMPNRDCTLASVNDGSATQTPTISTIASFVDSTGALLTTFVRDLPSGYSLVESGILMTRKAIAEYLTVDTLVATVTKGISTAAESEQVFGFVKSAITSKAGTWLVRGYLTYLDGSGNVATTYTTVEAVTVEGTGGVESHASFVAMSHNMKNGNTSYSTVASNAATIGADVVGMQEVGRFYYSSLASAMSDQGYAAVQGEMRDSSLTAEYNPIFYKSSKYTLHNSGTFWLSDTPDTANTKFSDLKYYRICTWAVLEDRTTGEFVQYFNTHLAATYGTEGVDSVAAVDALRFKQVKVLLTQIELIAKNCPSGVNNIVLGGDFNMISSHGIVKYLTGQAAYSGEENTIMGSRLRLARSVAGTTVPNSSGNYYTIDATGTLNADFDHLFVAIAGVEVDTYTVAASAAGSDHLPVYAACKLK